LGILILEDDGRSLPRNVGKRLFSEVSNYHRRTESHHNDELQNLLKSDIFRRDKLEKSKNIWAFMERQRNKKYKRNLVWEPVRIT